MKNKFISFEGGEGSGKTSTAKEVVKQLNSLGFKAVYTREPGGVELSEKIRDLILSGNNLSAEAETLLFAAARAQHVKEKVKPLLDDDYIVICDRFIDSSMVYQAYNYGLDESHVYNINMFATGFLAPSLTLYLDVPTEVGLYRVNSRNQEINRFDKNTIAFHTKVRSGFKRLAEKEPNRIKTVDATQPLNEVSSRCMSIILEELKR